MAIERVETHNSVYEIDREIMRARRVSGANPPVHVSHVDGEWYPIEVAEWLGFGRLWIKFTSGLSLITSTSKDSPVYVD